MARTKDSAVGHRVRNADRPPTVTRSELLVGGSDATFRNLVYDALAFFNRFEAVRDGYAALLGISGVQYTILASILDLQFHQSVGVSAIAERLHLSRAFVTIETGNLVKKGLIAKLPDSEDGRRVILKVTDVALNRLLRLSEIQRQVNDVNFENLSRDEFTVLCKIMTKLVAGTDRALSLLHHLTPPEASTATAPHETASAKRSRTSIVG